MLDQLSPAEQITVSQPSVGSGRRTWAGGAAVLALVVLLAMALPLFICMPVWTDVTFFDVCARTLLRGGVLYKDIFLHNLPGRVLVGTAIRATLGWRSEAIRAVDVAVLFAVIALLVTTLQPMPLSAAAKWWTVVAMCFYYFSTTEWCHCQPDPWMLLPALGALGLRQRQAAALTSAEGTARQIALRGMAEGVFWGAAFLFKPFIAAPALACWAATAGMVFQTRGRSAAGRMALDAGSVLVGGLLVGMPVIVWLWATGAWPYFLDGNLGTWNDEYFRMAGSLRDHTKNAFVRFWPWSLIHLIALPAAIGLAARAFWTRPTPARISEALLAVFYLAWWLQANYIQRQYDYQLVPGVLLAIALLASQVRLLSVVPGIVVVFPILAVWAAVYHPLLDARQLAVWPRCWREGSTAEVRDALTPDPQSMAPTWVQLAQVEEYLRSQGIRDRELTCYDLSTLPLYLQLDVEPSTRFVMLYAIVIMFNKHWPELANEVRASPQRFIVTDLAALPDVKKEKASQVRPGHPLALPPGMPPSFGASQLGHLYPWSEPVVFRAGRYFVHRFRPDEELRLGAPAQSPAK